MTNRLYYSDPYLQEFDATVTRVEERDGRTLVALDRTSFYPTSGGQPFDTGSLGDCRVVDVVDADDGAIAHVVAPDASRRPGPLDRSAGPKGPALQEGQTAGSKGPALQEEGRSLAKGPALQVGQTIHGVIDWPRRFDHMQQHTGQHVLSAAFDRLFGVRTVSFHLGGAVSTIDLARELTPRDIAAAESQANRIVWEDRPVTIRFADAEEAAQLSLRKEPKREGRLRLIEVDGFDLSACGGTHVARTGAIGIIAVGSWERFKGGQRLEFLCGGRALGRFHLLRDTTAAAMRQLSVMSEEVPGAIERLQADAKDQKRSILALQVELSRYRAGELAASAEATDRGRLVVRAIDADANTLKGLATAITASPGFAAVLVSTSTPPLVVVARSADLGVQANRVLAALTARFGGRGGGKPELAQGGGLNAAPEAILDAARALLVET